MFKTVLFPIDQSRNAQDAVSIVSELVKFCGSQLILLTVSGIEGDHENSNAITDQVLSCVVTFGTNRFGELEIEVKSIHRSGRPAFCMCDVADELDCELIMMSCRGIGLSDEHSHDSVSTRVINLSPCPVMVIP